MSHFTVAVFSKNPEDIERLLAPFDESPDNPDFLELFEADESMDDLRAEYEEKKQQYPSFEDFLHRVYGYEYNEELDSAGYICNPNAKWDWWVIGGRWSDILKLKPGRKGNRGEERYRSDKPRDGWCDQARVCDVDFTVDENAYRQAIRFWEVVVDGQPLSEGESPAQFFSYYRKEYFLEQFGNADTYAKTCSSLSTWAYLTPDGEWFENGRMGWFAAHDATLASRQSYADSFQQFIEGHQDFWITIVDCHI